MAKCIQDKRRVDLPLAQPFFKLMTTCASPDGLGEQKGESDSDPINGVTGSRDNEQVEDARNDFLQQEREPSNRDEHVWQHVDHPSSRNNDVVVVTERGAATSAKEAELQKLVTKEEEEITKDRGGEKELVLEELGEGGGEGELETTWFQGILQLEDLEEVNPHR